MALVARGAGQFGRLPAHRRGTSHGPAQLSSHAAATAVRQPRPTSAASGVPDAAFLKQVPAHLPQRAREVGRACARHARRLDASGARRRDVGEGRPQDPDRHDAAERRAAARSERRSTPSPRALERRLDAAADPNAALETPALHRLNRTEYANAIRDLLGARRRRHGAAAGRRLERGFDNIAEALAVSPSLIQGYVSAAMKISRQAVGDRTMAPSQITYPRRRRGWRRTATSTVCRSARAAACWFTTPSRSMRSTSSASAAAAAVRAPASTSRSTARRSTVAEPAQLPHRR